MFSYLGACLHKNSVCFNIVRHKMLDNITNMLNIRAMYRRTTALKIQMIYELSSKTQSGVYCDKIGTDGEETDLQSFNKVKSLSRKIMTNMYEGIHAISPLYLGIFFII